MSKNISISIILFSNNLTNIKLFIKEHVSQSYDINNFEILARVDEGDAEIIEYYESIKISKTVNLKYEIKKPLNYFQGWIGNNDMIPYVSKTSIFISCYGDRIYPTTKNWDKNIIENLNIQNKEIFRLCYSDYGLRSYKDIWEAGFAPSNVFFVSKKWLELNENFGPCFSHDAFSQCVSYYVEKFDNFNSNQYRVDIASEDIEFTGIVPEKKSDELEFKRVKGQIYSWGILVSGKIQREAKRRAMIIVAQLLIDRTEKKLNIIHSKFFNHIILISDDKKNKYKLSYDVSSLYLLIIKFHRISYFLNYTGGGFYENKKNFLFNLTYYLSRKYNFLKNINDFYNHINSKIFRK